jgi:hypothetical protein
MEESIPPKAPASEGILLAYKPGSLHSVQVLSIPNLELLVIKGTLVDDNDIAIATCHAPNERGKREQFLNYMIEVFRTKRVCIKGKTMDLPDTIILAGDFNTVPDTLLDRWLHKSRRTESPKLKEMLTIATDTYRKMHPEEYAYSWRKGSKNGIESQKSRIDLQLLSKSSKMEVFTSDIMTDFKTSSDHLPTELVLKLQISLEKTPLQRQARWKCKIPNKEQEVKINKLLKEKLQKEDKQISPEQFSFLLHQTLLELGLIQAVHESERKVTSGKRVANMTKTIERLQSMLANSVGKLTVKAMKLMHVAKKWARQLDINLPKPKAWTPQETHAVQTALAELQDTLSHLDIDPQVHHRSGKLTGGDKLIFDTCKYDGLKSPQPEFLRKKDKTFTKTTAEFLEATADWFINLFQGQKCPCSGCTCGCQCTGSESCPCFYACACGHLRSQKWMDRIPKADPRHSKKIIAPMKPEEVSAVIGEAKTGKAAGPDLIPYEVLKCLDTELIAVLTDGFNTILARKELPEEWRKAHLWPIWKTGSTNDWANYRPIALLQTQYKIFANVLNKRLQRFLKENNLLSPLQCGFRRDHSTANALHAFTNILQAAKASRIHVAYLDIQKAFDSVPFWAIRQSLRAHSCDEEVVQTMMMFYETFELHILTAKGTTSTIVCSKGVRQGCPLSPLIFSLFLNPLLWSLQASGAGWRGIGHVEIPALAYADDLVIASNEVQGIQQLLFIVVDFLSAYNMKLGVPKCAYTTNAEVKAKMEINGVTIPYLDSNLQYKYLGMWISLSLDWRCHLEKVYEKIDRALLKISSLPLSAAAKVIITNSKIGGMIGYTAQIIAIPHNALDRINQALIDHFLNWASLPKTLPRVFLHAPLELGGFGLLDVHKLQRCRYIASSTNAFFNSSSPIVNHIAKAVLERALAAGRVRRTQSMLENVESPNRNCTHGVYSINWLLLMLPKTVKPQIDNLVWLEDLQRKLHRREAHKIYHNSRAQRVAFTDGGSLEGVPTAAVFLHKETRENLRVKLPVAYTDSFSREAWAMILAGLLVDGGVQIVADSHSIISGWDTQQKGAHPWMKEALKQLIKKKPLFVPSHIEDKMRRDPRKWQDKICMLKSEYGEDFTCYTSGNTAADKLASSVDTALPHTLLVLQDVILAPGCVNIAIRTEETVLDGKTSRKLSEELDKLVLEEMQSFSGRGRAWRTVKERGASLSTLFSLSHSSSSNNRKIASFQRKALLGVLPTPSQMHKRNVCNLSAHRMQAYKSDLCPVCNVKANLKHILLECQWIE